MCIILNLRYACGHMSPHLWLINPHSNEECPGIVHETEPLDTREQCPSCTDILRVRGIMPETDAGRRMQLGYDRYDPDYRDPRLNYVDHIINLSPTNEFDVVSDNPSEGDDGDDGPPQGAQPVRQATPIAETNTRTNLSSAGPRNPGQGGNDYGEFIRWVSDSENIERTWYGNRQGDQGRLLQPIDARPQTNPRRTAANNALAPPALVRRDAIIPTFPPLPPAALDEWLTQSEPEESDSTSDHDSNGENVPPAPQNTPAQPPAPVPAAQQLREFLEDRTIGLFPIVHDLAALDPDHSDRSLDQTRQAVAQHQAELAAALAQLPAEEFAIYSQNIDDYVRQHYEDEQP